MEKKDLIIGAFTNYDFNQLKPWVESIDECGFTGDKAMVVGNATQETIDELKKMIKHCNVEGFDIYKGEQIKDPDTSIIKYFHIMIKEEILKKYVYSILNK